MIAAIGVGHRIAAVFEHDPDAADTVGLFGVYDAAAVGNAADDRHAVAERVAGNADHCVGDGADRAAGVARLCPVDRLSGCGIGTNFQEVGERA